MASPIKVLHITVSSMIGGGPEHVWQLVQHLPKNIDSFIAAPSCAPYGARFQECVGNNQFLPIPQRKFTLTAFLQLIRFIKKNKITIIHSHGKGAGIYARFAALCTKATSVHTFHGIHLPQNTIAKCLYATLERFLCAISKTCIAVSDDEAQEARALGFAPAHVTTIHNGVFIPHALPEKDLARPFKILHVSRFDKKQKNSLFVYDIALELQKKELLSQCIFILVGDGEELAPLQQKIESAGLGHYFEVQGKQESVTPFYQEAHCLLSTSRWEGLPLAVLEAQAWGVPAVVSNVVGNREAIKDKTTGLLFPINKAEDAATSMETILKSNDTWQHMRSEAHTRIKKNFSVAAMAERTANIYHQLTS